MARQGLTHGLSIAFHLIDKPESQPLAQFAPGHGFGPKDIVIKAVQEKVTELGQDGLAPFFFYNGDRLIVGLLGWKFMRISPTTPTTPILGLSGGYRDREANSSAMAFMWAAKSLLSLSKTAWEQMGTHFSKKGLRPHGSFHRGARPKAAFGACLHREALKSNGQTPPGRA
jgi:hypothetical protein